ncbi:MAG TPA: glycosyltransferase family 1 protein [Candidatus Kapabacteria bacterium]|nr:glycosyltransferase family 1 protein [Candidatus Kapabacteria bacterium]
MTLGIDASRANHAQKTGVEWYAYHVIQALKQQIPDTVRVILYSDTPFTGPLALLPSHWEAKVLSWPPKRLWTQVRLSYELFAHPVDVLFIPAHVFPLIHPKKTVMTIHDIAALRFPDSYSWFERWYSLFSARYAVKCLWKTITPSAFTKQELQMFVPTANNSTVIPHGYSAEYEGNVDAESVEQLCGRYAIRSPYILSIGRLETKKNTVGLLRAYERFRDKYGMMVQLVLIGKPGHGFDQVEACLETHPYRPDIVTTGWLEQCDSTILLHAAQVFAFPSLYEGFGLPVLEACASGVPVIASKGHCLEEVGGAAAIYLDSNDTEAWADALYQVMTDQTLRVRMIEKGKEQAKEFSWDACGQATADVLIRDSVIA